MPIISTNLVGGIPTPLKKYENQLGLLFMEIFIEGSLEVKLPTIWTVEKQR
jgi:hypothetical protein